MIEIAVGDDVANCIVEASKGPRGLGVSKVKAKQVRAAIQELSADFQEIILLREYEDFSYREIASILDCPVETVMSRLEGARTKLRTLLSATLKESDSVEVRGTT
jgi:RNA polymerase sigma-70 factor (ECF subfamily)